MISGPLRLTQGINIQYADIQLEIKFLDLPRDRAPVLGPTPAPLAAVAVTILSLVSAGVPLGMWGDRLGSRCQ